MIYTARALRFAGESLEARLDSRLRCWYYANKRVPIPLTKDLAKQRLVLCIEEGRVIYTSHFVQELRNDGLTMLDVQTVCRSGAVVEIQDQDVRTGEWKYRLEGRTVEADLVAVVFSFRAEQRAVFITVFKR